VDERQLRILRELGELGSVTAVAEALLVTPSAISQQLGLLQRSIPVPLTERRGRRLALTPAGEALAAAARDVESALARARHAVDAFVEAPDTDVSVAAFHSAASAFFPRLLGLAGFRESGPRLRFADEDVAQELFPRLTREYDVVLAHRPDHSPPWPGTVEAAGLLHEPMDVALPAGHRLAAKAALTARDVAGEAWITVHEGFPVLASFDAVGAAAGHRLDIVHRINEFAVALEVVAAGGGVALVPRWTAKRHPGVVLRPLHGIHVRRRVDALYRPERLARRGVRMVLEDLRVAAGLIREELE
jgi:DNA-binding transcriptional LysR family regulator